MFVRSLVSRSAGRAGIWDSRVRRNGVGGLSPMTRKLWRRRSSAWPVNMAVTAIVASRPCSWSRAGSWTTSGWRRIWRR